MVGDEYLDDRQALVQGISDQAHALQQETMLFPAALGSFEGARQADGVVGGWGDPGAAHRAGRGRGVAALIPRPWWLRPGQA